MLPIPFLYTAPTSAQLSTGQYFMISGYYAVAKSTTTSSWTTYSVPTLSGLFAGYNDLKGTKSQLVLTGFTTNSNKIAYSSNGQVFTASTYPNGLSEGKSVSFNNNTFVVAGYQSGNTGLAAYSINSGVTFATSSIVGANSYQFNASDFLNGQFVICNTRGSYNGFNIYTSTDGVTFSNVATFSTGPSTVTSITYGKSLYVLCSEFDNNETGQNRKRFAYSSDLLTWTASTTPTNMSLKSICYSSSLDRFVAVGQIVGNSGTPTNPLGTASIAWSDNGTSWSAASPPTDRSWTSVIYSTINSKFYALSDVYLIESSDGKSWTETNLSSQLTGVSPVKIIEAL
jgi:hypothetical protein